MLKPKGVLAPWFYDPRREVEKSTGIVFTVKKSHCNKGQSPVSEDIISILVCFMHFGKRTT